MSIFPALYTAAAYFFLATPAIAVMMGVASAISDYRFNKFLKKYK
jgi:hypothetical protein